MNRKQTLQRRARHWRNRVDEKKEGKVTYGAGADL